MTGPVRMSHPRGPAKRYLTHQIARSEAMSAAGRGRAPEGTTPI